MTALWFDALRGKRYIAANPWPLAAEAKRLGLPTDDFQESDFVPDDKVYIIDLDALTALPGAANSHEGPE